jgi:hypothetical protein
MRFLTSMRATAVALSAALLLPAGAARADNVATPGSFTGYGFDQCTAPTQDAMDAWLTTSKYWAVGIYISGDSRGCVRQPNLSPTWVRTQLAHGWRLLPITLGPQAWCTTRARYLHQVRISPSPGSTYEAARHQGRAEARKTVRAALALGISKRSTLWYDLEAFDTSGSNCRRSALWFLSSWTAELHRHDYLSGVYSSAASGLRMVDDARAAALTGWYVPDRVWIADWNGHKDTSSAYVRPDGWMPHKRVHQYRGGHDETHGGVTINVDSNWLDVGHGSRVAAEPAHCGGRASYDFPRYSLRHVRASGQLVRAAQCLLLNQGAWHGAVDGSYSADFGAAVRRYRIARGLSSGTSMTHATWTTLLSSGTTPVLKRGSASTAVRRLQRALNAADGTGLAVTGVFGSATSVAVRGYQGAHHLSRTGVVAPGTWRSLQAGRI